MLGKKRLIIFILTLLFSFNSFFYSPKADVIEFTNEDYSLEQYSMIDPREPITLTSGVVLAIVTLLSACGVAITTLPMAQDMAQRVFDKVKDIPGAITRVGDKIKFNLVKGVLEAVKGVVADLPKKDATTSTSTDNTVSTLPNYANICYLDGFSVGNSFKFYLHKSPASSSQIFCAFVNYYGYSLDDLSKNVEAFTLPANAMTGAYTITSEYVYGKDPQYGQSVRIEYKLYNPANQLISSMKTSGLFTKYNNWIFTKFGYYFGAYSGSANGYFSDSYSIVNNITIPYSPDTTKDVDYTTKPQQWLPNLSNPVFGGSISVPMNQPLPNISVDAPITSPNDLIADNDISIDATDTTIPDNSVDSDSVLDRILSSVTGFFDGFFDALGSLLAGLLAPIIALLELLKGALQSVIDFLKSILSAITSGIVSGITSLADLLQSILDFLLSLVVSLVDALVVALEGLFVPTIDLSKAFELPDNIFLPFHEFGFDNLLNIKPKPIRYDTVVRFGSVTYPIKIHFDEISVISNNITLIRNLFSYTLLLITINLAIAVHLPRKVMD